MTSHFAGPIAYTDVEATAVVQGTSIGTAVTVNGLAAAGLISHFTSTAAAGVSTEFNVIHTGVEADDMIIVSIADGNATTGIPSATVSAVEIGSFNITITNLHASAAFNGVITVRWAILKFGPDARS